MKTTDLIEKAAAKAKKVVALTQINFEQRKSFEGENYSAMELTVYYKNGGGFDENFTITVYDRNEEYSAEALLIKLHAHLELMKKRRKALSLDIG